MICFSLHSHGLRLTARSTAGLVLVAACWGMREVLSGSSWPRPRHRECVHCGEACFHHYFFKRALEHLQVCRLRGGGGGRRLKKFPLDDLAARARGRIKAAEDVENPANDSEQDEEDRVATGGIGTIRCANILFEGQPMGMLYEKKQDGENYRTATLVVGSSMGPRSILGRSRARTLKESGAPTEDEEMLTSGRRVYFERNRHGKWRAVLVPRGMTAKQLLKKIEAENDFIKTLDCDQRKQMEFERNRAILHAEAEGLKVVSAESERGLIKKLRKREKTIANTRKRFEQKARKLADDKRARDLERQRRLQERRQGISSGKRGGGQNISGRSSRRPQGGADGKKRALGKVRKTALGGTRRARRTGRHKKRKR